MPGRKGMTLLEIIVVLIMISVFAVIAFPNYNLPTEQARAANAQNNLLAIYSAQQNYNNNNSNYCVSALNTSAAACTADTTCADNLTQINCNLSLNIQDDGTYTYNCTSGPPPICTATRTTGSPVLVLTLNTPVALHGGNPTCSAANVCP